MADILVVDDEEDICLLIQGILEDEGYTTRSTHSATQTYKSFEDKIPDLVILDIWLHNSHHDGLQILETLKEKYPETPVVMISGHGNIETAVNAIKQGAYDFIEKPFKTDRLLLLVRRALETADLKKQLHNLKKRSNDNFELVGSSNAINSVQQILSRVANTNSRILITGEPGTGKDITARVIHQMSSRSTGPYMVLNCAVLHPDHLEVELFGSENDTNPVDNKEGVLEQADGGTLFLDEVADMPLETQGKIVRVLQEQSFRRLGGKKTIEVDVRILASTNRDLEKLMEECKFRQDLFYRLNVVPLQIAPLRERVQDIPDLVNHFVDLYSKQNGIPGCSFSQGAIASLQSYNWPGNVRQLRNMIEWIMIMYSGGNSGSRTSIKAEQLPPEIKGNTDSKTLVIDGMEDFLSMSLREARETFERKYLLSQINRFNGNISRTAQFIGMERSALHRKLKILDVVTPMRKTTDASGESVTRKTAKIG